MQNPTFSTGATSDCAATIQIHVLVELGQIAISIFLSVRETVFLTARATTRRRFRGRGVVQGNSSSKSGSGRHEPSHLGCINSMTVGHFMMTAVGIVYSPLCEYLAGATVRLSLTSRNRPHPYAFFPFNTAFAAATSTPSIGLNYGRVAQAFPRRGPASGYKRNCSAELKMR
jgi:hypothetical protein